jgi:tetratricopeptide (TPR) repeat protein
MGLIHLERGEIEQARELELRALAIRGKKLGGGDYRLAASYVAVGEVERASGQLDAALAHHLQALVVMETSSNPAPGHYARTLLALGETRLRRGEVDPAVAAIERALALREGIPGPPEDVAEARFALARALDAAHRDPARARTLAEQARETYRARRPDDLAEVERWLAAVDSDGP